MRSDLARSPCCTLICLVLLASTRPCRAWSFIQELRCGPGPATEESIAVSCKVDPQKHDLVSFMISRVDDTENWYFLHYTVEVEWNSSGMVYARIPSLSPGVEYRLGARTHWRGKAIGWRQQWSEPLVSAQTCRTAGGEPRTRRLRTSRLSFSDELKADEHYADAADDVSLDLDLLLSKAKEENRSTIWVEVFRHVGTAYSAGSPVLPDYLDQHNAADLLAAFSSPKIIPLRPIKSSSFHRYCVEIKIEQLNGVSTPFFPEHKYGNSMFADYVSCKAGYCRCMEAIDRSIAGQPWQTIVEHCNIAHDQTGRPYVAAKLCHCEPFHMTQSSKYVGMAPLLIPDWWKWRPPPSWDYRHERLRVATSAGNRPKTGHWFSFPVGGMCRPGTEVGTNGCSWRLHPLSYSMSLERLHYEEKVFDKDWQAPKDANDSVRWARNARVAYSKLGATPCGSSSRQRLSSKAHTELAKAAHTEPAKAEHVRTSSTTKPSTTSKPSTTHEREEFTTEVSTDGFEDSAAGSKKEKVASETLHVVSRGGGSDRPHSAAPKEQPQEHKERTPKRRDVSGQFPILAVIISISFVTLCLTAYMRKFCRLRAAGEDSTRLTAPE
eukprot:TRINITY_DN10292_c0_g2_i1.p1 TRINITY_DN10292_c0_g2~~TRINITY_DN10292_c0_g2_i1.p1  ORF type:complete len:606 (-),score=74.86 TRINITY_DN10292_c0_g2_i1:60-1877(-)